MANDDRRDFPHELAPDELADERSNWAGTVHPRAIASEWAAAAMEVALPAMLRTKYGATVYESLIGHFDAALADMTIDELADVGFELGVCVPWRVWKLAKEQRGAAHGRSRRRGAASADQPRGTGMTLWTVLQRDRLNGRTRDLREFFNDMDEQEAKALEARMTAYDRLNRSKYLAVTA